MPRGREAKGSFSLNTRELIVESGQISLKSPDASRLFQLITSADAADQMPPKDLPRLSSKEIATIKAWIEEDLAWESGFSFAPKTYEPPLNPRPVTLPEPIDGRIHPIDRLLDRWMNENNAPRPGPIDDGMFLRRIRMDLTGLLPEPDEYLAFVNDTDPQKRSQKIDELLNDRVAYADHWLSFYNDLLRNDYAGTGFITGGRKQISKWLYDSLLKNIPFDALARELIAPTSSESTGYIDGIKWRGEVSAGQTVEIQFAQSVAQSFLGINLKCASCHDSFIDRWKLEEAYGLAAIYSERELEIHRCDKPIGKQATAKWLFPELGQIDANAPRQQRLQQLAQLMTHADNGRFTRTIVNRIWHRMMGRGIVHPLDAMQTEPWNADLLDYLANYLASQSYDTKKLLAHIAHSQAYQSRSETVDDARETQYRYAGPRARRLTAEQFLDAVWQLTGAAPSKFDAPIFHAYADPAAPEVALPQAHWIWAATDGAPPAGQSIVFYKKVELDQLPKYAGALITCDNEFHMFINGREVDSSTNFTQLHSIAIQDRLKVGSNEIAIIGKNAGKDPNAAGLFFVAFIGFADSPSQTIVSDASWQCSDQAPGFSESYLGKLPTDWKPVTVVPTVKAWSDHIDPQFRSLYAQLTVSQPAMVRASLLKNTSLMRSLGRPTRDQIVSMRPTEMTTLEAIDLANEAELANLFQSGADRLVKQYPNDGDGLVQYLFQFALSRSPTSDESALFAEVVGKSPTVEGVQDALWSICMLPEFWLVH